MSNLANGRIILFHDIHERTIRVCKIIIPKIKELGYEIVSVSELFEYNNIELVDGNTYGYVKKN
jgi:peptidoglycan/xylan/chitin deacetylase (PgdA/CDA1 family)